MDYHLSWHRRCGGSVTRLGSRCRKQRWASPSLCALPSPWQQQTWAPSRPAAEPGAHLLPLRSDLSLGCASGKVCEGRLRQHVHSGWCQAVACGSVWTVPLGASSPGAPNTVALRVSEAGWGQGWDRCPRAGLMVSAHTRAVHRQRWVWPAGWLFLTGQRTRMTLKVFNHLRELPGGPVVKILYFHPEDAGLIPDWGTKIPEAVKHGQKVINI